MKALSVWILRSLCVFVALTGPVDRVHAQRCVDLARDFDIITETPSGKTLAVSVTLWGNMMQMYDTAKSFPVEYSIIDQGQLILDSTVTIPWDDVHYNYIDCIYTGAKERPEYRYRKPKRGWECENYQAFHLNDESTLIGFFLSSDLGHPFIFRISDRGDFFTEEIVLKENTKILTDEEYSSAMRDYIVTRFREEIEEEITLRPIVQSRTQDQVSISVGGQVIHLSTPADSSLRRAPYTNVILSSMSIPLRGFIDDDGNGPVGVYATGDFLYVTVFNQDTISCVGPDDIPFVYKIDIKKRAIIWQTVLPLPYRR